VFPDTQVNEMPYARTGKLFFTDADLNYSCSASIVRRRVVVTAAHCIYNTTANRFHSNFLFAPAYNANLATQPYGVWDWETVWAPNGWINGSETFPNQYDFGFIETRDFDTTVIGEYLGFFGWITNKVAGNSITQLGYSSNLDSGRRMIQNSSEARAASGGFAGVIGTGLHKGSSGGPWVQNFGRVAPGQVIVGGGSTNQITAVTSYGPKNNISPQYYSGATIFNSTFSSILNNTVCPHRTGNC
jgi:V8-like Glu-specific endopeptidase